MRSKSLKHTWTDMVPLSMRCLPVELQSTEAHVSRQTESQVAEEVAVAGTRVFYSRDGCISLADDNILHSLFTFALKRLRC
jgi:hypothetical protein